jgi:hypothetical protein
MESSRCEWGECSNLMGFLCGSQVNRRLCWSHMQEMNKSGEGYMNDFGVLNYFCRPIFRRGFCQVPNFSLVNAFNLNCLCWTTAEKTELPRDIQRTLDEMINFFQYRFFMVEPGNDAKIKEYCRSLAESLNEVIFNFQVNPEVLYSQIILVFQSYSNLKIDLISRLFLNELSDLEIKLAMPKTATKNLVTTLNLEAIRQKFILELFSQGKLNFQEIFKNFSMTFAPFLSSQPNWDIFDKLEATFTYELEKIQHRVWSELKPLIESTWKKNSFVRFSVFLKEIKESEPLEYDQNVIRLCQLILCESEIELKSITQISSYDLILIMEIDKHSFLIHSTEKKSFLIDVFPNTSTLCAEGSNESLVVFFTQTNQKCFAFHLQDSRLAEQQEIDLKLEEDEIVSSLLYIEGTRGKIVLSTNKYPLSSVLFKGPRCLVNIDHDLETGHHLKYHKSKQLIILSSNSKLRIFTEKLEKIQEFFVIYEKFCYVFTNSRSFRILGLKGENVEEIWLEVKLDYPERFYKAQPLPPSCIHLVTRSYEGIEMSEMTKELSKFFDRAFSIGS